MMSVNSLRSHKVGTRSVLEITAFLALHVIEYGLYIDGVETTVLCMYASVFVCACERV